MVAECRNRLLNDPNTRLIPRSCPRCGLGPCPEGTLPEKAQTGHNAVLDTAKPPAAPTVTIRNAPFVPVSMLGFGDPFVHEGLLYVKSRPALAGKERYNCVGVGHEGRIYLWKEAVIRVSITAEVQRDPL